MKYKLITAFEVTMLSLSYVGSSWCLISWVEGLFIDFSNSPDEMSRIWGHSTLIMLYLLYMFFNAYIIVAIENFVWNRREIEQ